MDTSKKYLITGGSGFLGDALIERLHTFGGFDNLRVVSRNEGQLIALKEKYPFIEVIPGDIASKFICEKACEGVSGIFHLAAFKHVGLAEKNVRECVFSNIMGTMNLLDQTKGMDFIIGISSDKAARVSGVYGATKMIMERLFTEHEAINKDCNYRSVRYGNVLYSTGSVLCKWKDKIINGEEIIVTDENATRFYWTVDEAIDLIFNCLADAQDSTPFSIPMKAVKVGTLLEVMIKKYSPNGKAKVQVIGLQEGENLHEIITTDGKSSENVEQYTKEELMNLI